MGWSIMPVLFAWPFGKMIEDYFDEIAKGDTHDGRARNSQHAKLEIYQGDT